MSILCLALFLNLSGQKNILNIKNITAIEDRSDYTRIYMSTEHLYLDTRISLKEVLEKLNKAKEECSK